ncbi:MAG: RNA polymerase sigma factor [Planctomycetota bacterium]
MARNSADATLLGMNSGAKPGPDDDTIGRFIAGDSDAFDSIYQWLAPQVLAYLTANLRSRQDAEDVSQTAWTLAWSKRRTFDGREIRAWIFQIARRRMIDTTRVQKRQGQASDFSDQPEPETLTDPSLSILRREELTAFEDCARTIGGIFVAALVKTKIMGHAPEAMAAADGVSRATIDSRVSRGRKLIEECLKEKGLGKASDA